MDGNINISGDSSLLQKKSFTKPPLTIEEQIALLESRGLFFGNKETAKAQLKRNAYYRLSGYMLPFYDKSKETFKSGTEFKDITELYYFDGDLKSLLMEALEVIEVDFKTKIINNLSLKYNNAHWFTDTTLFTTEKAFKNTQRIVKTGISKNKDSAFIKHYENTYSSPAFPPSRMVFQVLPFGEITIVYQALTAYNKTLIAKEYNLRHHYVESRINCLAYLRNLCAHSDRVWNRTMTKKLKIKGYEEHFNNNIDSLFSYLLVIIYFLKIISPSSLWLSKLKKLIKTHKSINCTSMGFPENWEKIVDSIDKS